MPGENADAQVKINGELLQGPRKLDHNDRILFGKHVFYLFVDPEGKEELKDWHIASEEANKDAVDSLVQAEIEK